MSTPTLHRLSSGWLYFYIGPQCWAQLPPGWNVDYIPAQYAFDSEWSLGTLNREWRKLFSEAAP